ncbi:MAG: DUF2834 domain-containing protein [Nitrospira sp.]|nr:DUF2834 domain-containing protein [Nitrospira sp.]
MKEVGRAWQFEAYDTITTQEVDSQETRICPPSHCGGYIALCVLYPFFIHEGLNLTGFLSALFANPPASGFTSDLLFTTFVFWIMIFHEQKHGDGPSPFGFIALNVTVGLSCALPAYLYARIRKS